MTERVFLDTNLLVHADDADSGEKRERAQAVLAEMIRSARAVVSTQILQEFFVVATRKLGIAADVAKRKVELLSRLEVVVIRPDLVLGAIDLHRLHSLSFWDALVVKAAAAAGCGRVLTEDMPTGTVIDGVRIENPFV